MKKSCFFFALMLTFLSTQTIHAQHEYVDLGLPSGTLWATCNIGASSPEESGDCFAWGETDTKSNYTWENYKHCMGTYNSMTKYCPQSEYGYNGFTDNLSELLPEDDAATANWGSDWQMPSREQFDELVSGAYTIIERAALNGVSCIKITGKINGKSIYLPGEDAGYGLDGCYWSRSNVTDHEPYFASYLDLYITGSNYSFRYFGFNVRPVRRELYEHEYVDLGLPSGTLWATCNIGASSPEEYGGYFAWGETDIKDNYNWESYKHSHGGTEKFTKYVINVIYGHDGFKDDISELLPEDDAAAVNWGSYWQMPSLAQINELCNPNYTTVEQATMNGVNGFKVTSRSNGSSIFFPAAGRRDGTDIIDEGTGCCFWTRSLYTTMPNYSFYANALDFNVLFYRNNSYRNIGLCVRPVRAQRIYTEFDADSGVLTYYFDMKRDTRKGVTELYEPTSEDWPNAVRFTGYHDKVTKIVIDPSMQDAQLISMHSMFYGGYDSKTYALHGLSGATSIEGLEYLNTSKVTDMTQLFYRCSSLKTLDLSSFNTEKVTTMESMFSGCFGLEMVDVTSFNINKVTSMAMMFFDCEELTTICCKSNWYRSKIASLMMFKGCEKLVGGQGTKYDSSVTDNSYARPDGGSTKPGYFTADTMTGISQPDTTDNEGTVYNLAGQRLDKMQKGINIIKGKKVLIK